MHRGILVTVVIVLVLAIAGVGLALFWQPGGNVNLTNNGNANTNSVISENTNTAVQELSNTNFSYRAEALGAKDLDASVTYRDAEIVIDRVEVKTGFDHDRPAAEGMKAVYVYLAKQPLEHDPHISIWLDEVKLQDSGGQQYLAKSASFPAPARYDTVQPYIQYEVEQEKEGFSLVFVRSGEEKTLDLGI